MQANNRNTLPEIRHTAIFHAPIQKVWEAISTSEGIAAWFMPNDFQPKAGHEFTLQTPFGPTPCKVLELNPPYRLSFSWGNDWRVSFELKDLEGKTQFTLIHSGWGEPDQIVQESGLKQSEVRNRMDHGWKSIVTERLREVVEA